MISPEPQNGLFCTRTSSVFRVLPDSDILDTADRRIPLNPVFGVKPLVVVDLPDIFFAPRIPPGVVVHHVEIPVVRHIVPDLGLRHRNQILVTAVNDELPDPVPVDGLLALVEAVVLLQPILDLGPVFRGIKIGGSHPDARFVIGREETEPVSAVRVPSRTFGIGGHVIVFQIADAPQFSAGTERQGTRR